MSYKIENAIRILGIDKVKGIVLFKEAYGRNSLRRYIKRSKQIASYYKNRQEVQAYDGLLQYFGKE